MTRRQQGARLKEIVKEVTGLTTVRVVSGRGTARSWWDVITPNCDVSQFHRERVEKLAGDEKLLGYYFSDSLPGRDTWEACVSWRKF